MNSLKVSCSKANSSFRLTSPYERIRSRTSAGVRRSESEQMVTLAPKHASPAAMEWPVRASIMSGETTATLRPSIRPKRRRASSAS